MLSIGLASGWLEGGRGGSGGSGGSGGIGGIGGIGTIGIICVNLCNSWTPSHQSVCSLILTKKTSL